MANPAEIAYPLTGRTVYFIRSSLLSGASFYVYNTSTGLYEAYNASHIALYKVAMTEVVPRLYRGVVPAGSLTTPATEYYFDQQGGTPDLTADTPIGSGNSQGSPISTIDGVISQLGSNVSAVVDICNLALSHLGQSKITALTDSTEAARRCNQVYNTCLDEVLALVNPKFATVIATLSALSSETVTGWSYVFTYPTDCVFIRKVYADDSSSFNLPVFSASMLVLPQTNPDAVDFKVVYQSDLSTPVIVTNVSPAYIEYTARVADPSIYDSLFKKALSYKLASELAVVLNGDKFDSMNQKFIFWISEAMKTNANQNGIPPKQKSTYLDAR